MNLMKVHIVVPCYDEEAVLPELFERLTRAANSWDLEWNVICVDDGSSDRTWTLLQGQFEKDSRWKAISFSRNFGHQIALSAGIHHCADADAVLLMDADLQDPPEELYRFINAWKDGAEVVYAVREKRKEGPLKRFCYWAFYRLMKKLVSIEIPLDSGDFCLMDAKVVAVINNMPERNRFLRGLRAWSGFKQVGVPYERHSRAAGEAKYTFQKLIKLAADGIFNFSGLPLKLASHMGFWISLISLLGAIFTFLQRVFADQFAQVGLAPVPGFATIVIAILFLGGVQLICLGILGEYLVRIFEEVKQRPPWIIRESCGIDQLKPR
ncbi:MAG: glycosyltransferase family 2 protein [Puniceicoccaceae bacterium]